MYFLKAASALLLSCVVSLASAGEIKPFTQQAFDKLTSAGQSVVVDVTAPWCPTCRAQKPILEDLMSLPAYADVTLLTVDFDSDKPTLRRFKVHMQSTLIAFKGKTEVARSVGDTSPAGIESLIEMAVK